MSIESRHSSLLNVLNEGSFAPQSFDIAFRPEQVLAIAGGFLEGCSASDLGLTANAAISVSAEGGSSRFSSGNHLSFQSSSVDLSGNDLQW
jgi:hypothetical protein